MSVLSDIWNKITSDPGGSASNVITAINDPTSLIQEIDLQTVYGPDIVVRKPLVGSSGPGAGETLLRTFRPKVTMKFGSGIAPVVFKPWGEPGPTKWPVVQVAAIAGAAGLLYLALRGLFCSCSK